MLVEEFNQTFEPKIYLNFGAHSEANSINCIIYVDNNE